MLLTDRNWSPVLSIRKVRVLVGVAAALFTRTLPRSTAGGESGVTLIVRTACATPPPPIHTTTSNSPSQRLDIIIDDSPERGRTLLPQRWHPTASCADPWRHRPDPLRHRRGRAPRAAFRGRRRWRWRYGGAATPHCARYRWIDGSHEPDAQWPAVRRHGGRYGSEPDEGAEVRDALHRLAVGERRQGEEVRQLGGSRAAVRVSARGWAGDQGLGRGGRDDEGRR